MSDRLILSLEFDRDGLLWIGTANGLNRFDGYELIDFRSNSAAPAGQQLSRSRISTVHLLADGRLGIFYEDLLTAFDVFDPYSLQVKKVEVSLGKGIAGVPRCLYANPEGEVMVMTRGEDFTGLYAYELEEDHFTEVWRISDQWELNYPQLQMLQLFDGRFLLYDRQHGLRSLNAEGELLRILPPPDTTLQTLPSSLSVFHQSKDGLVWISYRGASGMFSWNGSADTLRSAVGLPRDKLFEAVWEDQQGNLLFNQASPGVATSPSEGLWCRRVNGEIVDFSHLLDVSDYFVSVAARDFFRSLFVGTDTGLKLAQNSRSLVKHYLSQDIGEDRRGYSMRNITGDGHKRVFIAREVSCWYQLDLETDLLDTIFLRREDTGEIINFACGVGLFYDEEGYLWGASCEGQADSPGMLHRYDLASCETKTYEYPYLITAMERTPAGDFWLGIYHADEEGQLVFFDKQRGLFIPFTTPDGANPLKGAYPRYLKLSQDGTLWIGTENGLFHLDPNTGECVHYLQQGTGDGQSGAEEVPMLSNAIYVIHESPEGVLWLGTAVSLTRFDPATGQWHNYTMEDGLAGETVCGILPDDRGALWVSTYNGLSYFDPSTELARRFYRIDGFSHNEFNRFSFYRDQEGRYYFGGVNGVNAFYPEELFVDRDIPCVLLTSFSRYNSRTDSVEVQYADLTNVKELVIPYYYDYFSLDFALPIYTPTANNQFRYRIGTDPEQEWIYMEGGRSIRYNDLRPGRYALQVQGSDPNGNWSTETLTLRVVVKEIFFRTWWFISLLVLGIGVFLYSVFRARAREQLRMERLRT
ncbi:MAG: hypothetical protein KDC54_09495, partial [Lewinella sp.]|nr:hypothetical protein [Lewinella sp.]